MAFFVNVSMLLRTNLLLYGIQQMKALPILWADQSTSITPASTSVVLFPASVESTLLASVSRAVQENTGIHAFTTLAAARCR